MTEYSDNELEISGPLVDVLRFKKFAKGKTPLDFHKFSTPKVKLSGFDSEEWYYTNWGCKWNAEEVKTDLEGNKLTYTFATANGVPEPIVKTMAKMFPTLDFELDYGTTWDGGGSGVLHIKPTKKPVKVKQHVRKGRPVRQHRRRK